jgi:hypothetical protein
VGLVNHRLAADVGVFAGEAYRGAVIMAETIAPEDVKLRYVSLAEAKTLPGLRLILGARAIPGPWREACKAIFHVKQVSYVPVASRGADGSDSELYDWTAQQRSRRDLERRTAALDLDRAIVPGRAPRAGAEIDPGRHRRPRRDVRLC